MQQASKQYFKIAQCKSTGRRLANDEMVHPRPVLNATLHLFFTDPLYSFRWRKNANCSAYDELLVSDMKKTVGLVTDLLRMDGHAAFSAPLSSS